MTNQPTTTGTPSPSFPRIALIGPPDAVCAAARLLCPLSARGEETGAPARCHILGAVTLSPLVAEMIRDFDDPAAPSVPNLGVIEDLGALHARSGFDLAVVCIPGAFARAAQRARDLCARLRLPAVFLPTPDDILSGAAASAGGSSTSSPAAIGAAGASGSTPPAPPSEGSLPYMERQFDPSFLIGRAPRALDERGVARARGALHGKRVLITGAGGSIGSELALAVAAQEPEQIILMERAENALFEIDRRLSERFPRLARRSMLHDVVEEQSTREWLAGLRPHVVFHAAAHKHVTVMEDHPAHAVNNNVFGSKSIADAALAAGVERFVMISSDKAVNPRNVMGATKRFAELYVRSRNEGQRASRFTMVRFGNVLGSACSVLPIWSRQLAEGGPLTVTHPEMTRFFMTIPEAAQLVIQAGALSAEEAKGADIFVLDMGEPVRIVELAERFSRAHALTPRIVRRADATPGARDTGGIDIVFTGPRPGEKLHEELAHSSEELRPTPAPGVLAWAGAATSRAEADAMVSALAEVRWSADKTQVLRAIGRLAPGVGAPVQEAGAPGAVGPGLEAKSLGRRQLEGAVPGVPGSDLSAA